MEWGLGGAGRGPCPPGPALTADVCVGRQAVAQQLHVPPWGIHAALGAEGQPPCQPARSARSDPNSQPRVDPDPASSGSSPRWKSSPRVRPGVSSSLTLLQTRALPGGSFPWTQTPLQLERSGKWAAGGSAPLWGPHMTPGFAVPVVGWRRERRVPSPLAGRAPGRGSRLPLPSCPPHWDPPARRPGLTHRQRPASPLPAPARPAAAYTRDPAAPAPSGPVCPACHARLPGRGSGGRTRADGPADGKFPPRKEEGRGEAGRGEAGRKRAGRGRGEERATGRRGSEAGGAVCSPTGNRWGGRWQGPAPKLLITKIIIRMKFCLGARQSVCACACVRVCAHPL